MFCLFQRGQSATHKKPSPAICLSDEGGWQAVITTTQGRLLPVPLTIVCHWRSARDVRQFARRLVVPCESVELTTDR
jgi:hypothetical protein